MTIERPVLLCAVSALLSLLAGHNLSAQWLPARCDTAAAHARSLYWGDQPPLVTQPSRQLVTTALRKHAWCHDGCGTIADSGSLRPLFSAWRKDSLQLESALAEAVTSSALHGHKEASLASAFYRALSGRAEPMLYYMFGSRDALHRQLALSAIKKLSTQDQREATMHTACVAAWQLSPFVFDPAYANRWLDSNAHGWSLSEVHVLEEAARLLDGKDHETIEALWRLLNGTALRLGQLNGP